MCVLSLLGYILQCMLKLNIYKQRRHPGFLYQIFRASISVYMQCVLMSIFSVNHKDAFPSVVSRKIIFPIIKEMKGPQSSPACLLKLLYQAGTKRDKVGIQILGRSHFHQLLCEVVMKRQTRIYHGWSFVQGLSFWIQDNWNSLGERKQKPGRLKVNTCHFPSE